jgi:hypothetical protein
MNYDVSFDIIGHTYRLSGSLSKHTTPQYLALSTSHSDGHMQFSTAHFPSSVRVREFGDFARRIPQRLCRPTASPQQLLQTARVDALQK